MTKLLVAFLVVSLVAFVSASDDDDDDSGFSGLFTGDKDIFPDFFKPKDLFNFAKNYKPGEGEEGEVHVKSTSHEEASVNRKKILDKTSGDQTDNVDGSVTQQHTGDPDN